MSENIKELIRKKKFVIVADRNNMGGPMVLRLLCKLLIEKGVDTKMLFMPIGSFKHVSYGIFLLKYIFFLLNRDLKKMLLARIVASKRWIQKLHLQDYVYEPVPGFKRKWLPWVDDDTIVIYPETVYGNRLHAKNVVRWMLYFSKYEDHPESYGDNDLFFAFREVFNSLKVNPNQNYLRVRNFDYDTYRDFGNDNRYGTCYIVRKGADRADLPKNLDGPIIDDLPEHEKVKIFNRSKYCVSYDTQTFYSSIAAYCGCISIVVPEPGKTRADYTGEGDSIVGVAYGDTEEEIAYAIRTRDQLNEKIDSFRKENEIDVERFLKICEAHFIRKEKQ